MRESPPNTMKRLILGAVVDGEETAFDIWNHVCSSSADARPDIKLVMNNLLRYSRHDWVLRMKIKGRYHYTPNGGTYRILEYLESNTRGMTEWVKVDTDNFQLNGDCLGLLHDLWLETKDPGSKKFLLSIARYVVMRRLSPSRVEGNLRMLLEPILQQVKVELVKRSVPPADRSRPYVVPYYLLEQYKEANKLLVSPVML